MVTIDVAADGTAEERWLRWLAEAAPSPLASPARPVVVAPHPDDEVLGAGGLLAMTGGGEIVAVTDGEAAHPHLDGPQRRLLAARRRIETAEALAALCAGHLPVHRLGQPDGDVDEAALADRLVPLLAPGRWCVATWRGDGHPDHEAVGRAAAAACAATGARLVEYPVWMWHWAAPGDPRVPWARARRLTLTAAAARAKASAIALFGSQLEPLDGGPPVLPAHVVARFHRPYEVFFG
jgi:LmbE family N-acetylglucosaminyl deacetylase